MRVVRKYRCTTCEVERVANLVPICWAGCGRPMVDIGSTFDTTDVPSELDMFLAPYVSHEWSHDAL